MNRVSGKIYVDRVVVFVRVCEKLSDDEEHDIARIIFSALVHAAAGSSRSYPPVRSRDPATRSTRFFFTTLRVSHRPRGGSYFRVS